VICKTASEWDSCIHRGYVLGPRGAPSVWTLTTSGLTWLLAREYSLSITETGTAQTVHQLHAGRRLHDWCWQKLQGSLGLCGGVPFCANLCPGILAAPRGASSTDCATLGRPHCTSRCRSSNLLRYSHLNLLRYSHYDQNSVVTSCSARRLHKDIGRHRAYGIV
jgi:hypothetical protein